MKKNFGLFLNPYNSENVEQIIDILRRFYNDYKVNFYLLCQENSYLPDFVHKTIDENLDMILVFGGDGTILRAKEFAIKYNAPILGINTGNLGFLSEITLDELDKFIKNLLNQKYKLQERMLLKVSVKRDRDIVFSHGLALNDVVIYKGVTPKLLDLSVYSNKRSVVETRCDGLIISTPTGSTAYSLSAGGPILSPIMHAIVVAPLNPHVLTVRPMVFSSTDLISVKVFKEAVLQIDGKNSFNLVSGDLIITTASAKKVAFVKLGNRTFYQILRKKLHMGKK